jgi:hypothetical protein
MQPDDRAIRPTAVLWNDQIATFDGFTHGNLKAAGHWFKPGRHGHRRRTGKDYSARAQCQQKKDVQQYRDLSFHEKYPIPARFTSSLL